jgi:hypothetical protein
MERRTKRAASVLGAFAALTIASVAVLFRSRCEESSTGVDGAGIDMERFSSTGIVVPRGMILARVSAAGPVDARLADVAVDRDEVRVSGRTVRISPDGDGRALHEALARAQGPPEPTGWHGGGPDGLASPVSNPAGLNVLVDSRTRVSVFASVLLAAAQEGFWPIHLIVVRDSALGSLTLRAQGTWSCRLRVVPDAGGFALAQAWYDNPKLYHLVEEFKILTVALGALQDTALDAGALEPVRDAGLVAACSPHCTDGCRPELVLDGEMPFGDVAAALSDAEGVLGEVALAIAPDN